MPNKIHITMFGQFSISYRGKRLCENEYRGSKMISLLEYLISQRGRERPKRYCKGSKPE